MGKVVEMKSPCLNCGTPKKPGHLCEECGFWLPEDKHLNPNLRDEMERFNERWGV